MSSSPSSTHSGNRSLSSAKAAKQDEFYTQLADIENELKHYRDHFAGKVVLCNCDDPFESNFFQYFALNFNSLGLKKLVCTSYSGSPIVGGQLPLTVMEGLKPEGSRSGLWWGTIVFAHDDPADRFIAATAFHRRIPRATSDIRLRSLPWLKTLP